MKYFLIETDENNKIPYNINKNRALDIRLLTKENINRLPLWNVVGMSFPSEGFFPDLLCHPCILVSEKCIKTITMYQADIPYKGIKLWDKESSANATYFLPVLDELDCISDKTEYNHIGNRITRLVLSHKSIGSNAVFKIKNFDRNCIVGRVDFVESILRRGVMGIRLTEVEYEDGE